MEQIKTIAKKHEPVPHDITTYSIPLDGLKDRTAYRGIAYTSTGDSEKAAENPDNYMLDLNFNVMTCDEKGDLVSYYEDKNTGEQKLSHSFTKATLSANMAQLSDVEQVMHVEERKLAGNSPFAEERKSYAQNKNIEWKDALKGRRLNEKNPPIQVTDLYPNSVTMVIHTEELALESACRRIDRIGTGKRSLEESLQSTRTRLLFETDPVKTTVDGVGCLTAESAHLAVCGIAATKAIALNSDKNVQSNCNGAFNAKVIEDVCHEFENIYNETMKEVADAVNENKTLAPLKDYRSEDKKATVEGTGLPKSNAGVKMAKVNGAVVVVCDPAKKSATDIDNQKARMKDITNVIQARVKEKVAERSSEDYKSSKLSILGSCLAKAPIIAMKEEVNGETKLAGVTMVSPGIAGSYSVTGTNLHKLNAPMSKTTLEDVREAVGAKVFDCVQAMAKNAVKGHEKPELDKEQFKGAQKAALDKLKDFANSIDEKAFKNITFEMGDVGDGGSGGPKGPGEK